MDQSSPYALGQFLHERFDAPADARLPHGLFAPPGGLRGLSLNWNTPKDLTYAALTPPAWSLAVQHAAVADIATLTATDTLGLAKGIAIVITFHRHQPAWMSSGA